MSLCGVHPGGKGRSAPPCARPDSAVAKLLAHGLPSIGAERAVCATIRSVSESLPACLRLQLRNARARPWPGGMSIVKWVGSRPHRVEVRRGATSGLAMSGPVPAGAVGTTL